MCDWGGGPNEIQNYMTRNPERQPEGTDPASPEDRQAQFVSAWSEDTDAALRALPAAAASVAGFTTPPLDDVERLALALIEHRANPAQYTRGATHVCASRRCAADILARLAGSTEPVTEEPR